LKHLPEKNIASIKDGFWFVFHDGDITITAGGSSVSGKEYIYINQKLVTEKRSIKKKSEHIIEFNGNKYTIIFHMKKIMTGDLKCSLLKNDTLLKAYQASYNSKFIYTKFGMYTVGGLVLGIFTSYFNISIWYLIAIGLVIIYVDMSRVSKNITIEEV